MVTKSREFTFMGMYAIGEEPTMPVHMEVFFQRSRTFHYLRSSYILFPKGEGKSDPMQTLCGLSRELVLRKDGDEKTYQACKTCARIYQKELANAAPGETK